MSLYSVQEDGSHGLCIPRSLAKEDFVLVHDKQGRQGFNRCRRKMECMVIYRGMHLFKQYIIAVPNVFATTRGDKDHMVRYSLLSDHLYPSIPSVQTSWLVGLPTLRAGYNAIASISCKFTNRRAFNIDRQNLGQIPDSYQRSRRWAMGNPQSADCRWARTATAQTLLVHVALPG
jgi:hypothetical protein